MKKKYKEKRLGEICDISIGRTPRREVTEYWGTGYTWVSISDMKGKVIKTSKEEITEAAISALRCKPVRKGTLMMSFKLSIGKLAFAGKDLFTNEAIAALPIKDPKEIDADYLFFALKYIPLVGSNQAAKGKTLNKDSLYDIKIPLPETLDDQIRIATLLSRAEEMIEKRRESLGLLDDLVKGVFLEMFGDPIKNEKNLGVRKLGSFIVHLTSGGRGWSEYYHETGTRFIRSMDVQMNHISDDEIVYVVPPNNAEAERTKVKEGDVLLTITGSRIGRVAFVPKGFGDAFVSQHVAIIRTEGISPVYLSYYLSMENAGQYLIRKNQYGQTKPGLNFTQIEKFDILFPSPDLQAQFAATVQRIEALKGKYEASLKGLEALYGSMSGRAFRGELEVGGVEIKYNMPGPIDSPVAKSISELPMEEEIADIITKGMGFAWLLAEHKKSENEGLQLTEERGKYIIEHTVGKKKEVSAFFKKYLDFLRKRMSFEQILYLLYDENHTSVEEYSATYKEFKELLKGEDAFLKQEFDTERGQIMFRLNETA